MRNDKIHFLLHGDEYFIEYVDNTRKFLGRSHICNCCSIIIDKDYSVLVNATISPGLSLPPDGVDLTKYIVSGQNKCLVTRVEKVITTPALTFEITPKVTSAITPVITPVTTPVIIPSITEKSLKLIFSAIKSKLSFELLTTLLSGFNLTPAEFLSVEMFKRFHVEFGYSLLDLRDIVLNIVCKRVGITYDDSNNLNNYNPTVLDLDNDWIIYNNHKLTDYINRCYNITYGNAIISCITDKNKNQFVMQLVDEFKEMIPTIDYKPESINRIIEKMLPINTPLARKVIILIAPLLEKYADVK